MEYSSDGKILGTLPIQILEMFKSSVCIMGIQAQEVHLPKIAWKFGHFTREIALNNEDLRQFCPCHKVLWMTWEQLFEIFIEHPMSDCSRAICVLLQGQNQLLVPSGWGKARQTSNEKMHRTPSCGHIESIKSAGKRSQNGTLITCPRYFLGTLNSCRIYVPKNAILQVNPLGTNLDFLLFLPST